VKTTGNSFSEEIIAKMKEEVSRGKSRNQIALHRRGYIYKGYV
jgi:hypothetical protein